MADESQQTADTPAKVEPRRRATRRKRERRELRVAFDTNVLFTGSTSDLVRQEATSLISQSKFPDLGIQWYLPEVVRLERQFQMQKGALELLAPLARVEKLLGHNLNITEELLIDRVEKVIAERQKELGLIALKPEYANLDWDRLVLDATFRRAPFQEGKTEKGFRDALVVESFIHLVNISPKSPAVCRVVLVTADSLVSDAVRARMAGAANVHVLASLEELRGFMNTLVSEVDEAFLASLRPKAEKLFFAVKDKSTLYYKEPVRKRLEGKFAAELAALPAGATSRKNGTWRISAPNFSKKIGQRIHWTSRIEIDIEATKTIRDEQRPALSERPAAHSGRLQNLDSGVLPTYSSVPGSLVLPFKESSMLFGSHDVVNAFRTPLATNLASAYNELAFTRSVATHKGTDVYDVLWSVDVTTALDLRRPSVDDIVHVDTIWEAVA